jgi:hypothetical protein
MVLKHGIFIFECIRTWRSVAYKIEVIVTLVFDHKVK